MSVTTPIQPGYQGLLAFCELIGEPLPAYQRRIARAYFGPAREICAVLPRGNAKTTIAALIGLHHLVSTPGAAVTIAAASRDQARICFERMRGFAQHPALDGVLVIRHLELRHEDGDGLLRVVASDGPRAHGLSSTLYIADEAWAHRNGDLIEAMQTGLIKRPDSKLLVISTAAAQLDSPLGRLRARALAQRDVRRSGAVLEARPGRDGLHWLEWSLPEDGDPDDMAAVKAANPAPWIKVADLRRQRSAIAEIAFLQFHCCSWGVGEGAWLPPGAWAACAGTWAPPDEPVWLGVDIGGSRAASAVIGVTAELRVAEVHILEGDDAVLAVPDVILGIARRRSIMEVAYDPWRFRSEALRLERDHGMPMIEFPQSHSRMTAASESLHAAITSQRLQHPAHPDLDRHVAGAVAKQTGRGWRLDQREASLQIDGVIALAMCVERAEQPVRRARVLGWL